jgi:predicted transcriptional regulator/transcriptional regulator with XRE-family HTH domain
MFMGVRLRRLREAQHLTQAALAAALGLSASYLNQLENNQRPLTVPVLLKLNRAYGLDVQVFSDDDEARLLAQVREACLDVPDGEAVSQAELRELALNMPAVARVLSGLHQRYRDALDQAHAASVRLGDDRGDVAIPPAAFETVRDFFYARRNHIADLDRTAEALAQEEQLAPWRLSEALIARLGARHGVSVQMEAGAGVEDGVRRYDPSARILKLSRRLADGQRAFQLATQLAFLEHADLLEAELAGAGLDGEAHSLAQVGLANYFAGAVILPYGRFLAAAEAARYDIEALSDRFGVGFETICHRLSTLQRPGAAGVPFIFVRTDRAGNISKRQSATDFHFSRFGGTCPLWNVYEAFAQPDRVSVQLAEMPDGGRYLWVARTVRRTVDGYRGPEKLFAVGLGCELRHAGRLIYSRGLELADPCAFVPIGLGCRVCDRSHCIQRASPPLGRRLAASQDESREAPYWYVV